MHSTAVYLIGTHTHTNLIEIETKRETYETRSMSRYITENKEEKNRSRGSGRKKNITVKAC